MPSLNQTLDHLLIRGHLQIKTQNVYCRGLYCHWALKEGISTILPIRMVFDTPTRKSQTALNCHKTVISIPEATVTNREKDFSKCPLLLVWRIGKNGILTKLHLNPNLSFFYKRVCHFLFLCMHLFAKSRAQIKNFVSLWTSTKLSVRCS